jgi:hypothetical protein
LQERSIHWTPGDHTYCSPATAEQLFVIYTATTWCCVTDNNHPASPQPIVLQVPLVTLAPWWLSSCCAQHQLSTSSCWCLPRIGLQHLTYCCRAGAIGYIGSLVGEQLLRATSLKRIFLPMLFPHLLATSHVRVPCCGCRSHWLNWLPGWRAVAAHHISQAQIPADGFPTSVRNVLCTCAVLWLQEPLATSAPWRSRSCWAQHQLGASSCWCSSHLGVQHLTNCCLDVCCRSHWLHWLPGGLAAATHNINQAHLRASPPENRLLTSPWLLLLLQVPHTTSVKRILLLAFAPP